MIVQSMRALFEEDNINLSNCAPTTNEEEDMFFLLFYNFDCPILNDSSNEHACTKKHVLQAFFKTLMISQTVLVMLTRENLLTILTETGCHGTMS